MKKFTILIAAIALVCFSVPAMAADWNFYGSARMQTTYMSDDFDDTTNAAKTDDKDAATRWDLQGNTRFGARVKGEKMAGRMEFGVNESTITSRLLWGEWNFGAGKLLVGKDYTPGGSQFNSSSIQGGRAESPSDDSNILGIGSFYGGRNGQITLSFGGFKIALINSTTGLLTGMADSTTSIGGTTTIRGTTTFVSRASATTYKFSGDVDDTLPKLQVEWGMAFDTWNFSIAGGAQTFEIEDVKSKKDGSTNDVDVTSGFLSAMGAWNIGAFTLKPALSYAVNGGNAGWTAGAGSWDGDDDVDDVKTFQGSLVGVFRLSDMLAFELGGGYRQDKLDADVKEDKLKSYQVYVQALWTMAPGVYLMPELGYIDWGNTSADKDMGNTIYAGAKWQIDF
jgi:hypothetical protein